MPNLYLRLYELVEKIYPQLKAICSIEARLKTNSKKWSKQEILGHLVDSACNNQQKLVRAMLRPHTNFIGYQQDNWVENQAYQQSDWLQLIEFWQAYNKHLAHLMKHIPESNLFNTISVDEIGPFTLQFIMEDYIEHLLHHLKAILPEADLETKFQNIYNT